MVKLKELNSYETDFLFGEIFQNRVYFQNGIHLAPGATVVDVGANIGLFCQFVKEECPSAKVYAFEPVPAAYDCLAANCRKYEGSVRSFPFALSSEAGEAAFVYYPGYSVISGLCTDLKVDIEVIETGTRASQTFAKVKLSDAEVHELVSKRFETRQTLSVKTLTLSDFIEAEKLERIDLLKIDAERSEADILAGIKPWDWEKIEQIVLEVHSKRERGLIQQLLEDKGFRVFSKKDEALAECEIGTLYGVRR